MLFTFYSRERLFSTDARARWVDPDLAPLRLDAVDGRPDVVAGLQTRPGDRMRVRPLRPVP